LARFKNIVQIMILKIDRQATREIIAVKSTHGLVHDSDIVTSGKRVTRVREAIRVKMWKRRGEWDLLWTGGWRFDELGYYLYI